MKKIIFALALLLSACSSANLEDVKGASEKRWAEVGFKVVGYEGFEWGSGFGNYGGAKVWSRLQKIPDNGITYSGYLVKWGGEYHVYGPIAIDAIHGGT